MKTTAEQVETALTWLQRKAQDRRARDFDNRAICDTL